VLVLVSVPIWPIVWLVAVASLARLSLGFWPFYGHPDPKDLDWPFLTEPPLFEYLLFLVAPLAVLVSVGLAFSRCSVVAQIGRPFWGHSVHS
jgi:hypothetical protein